ncbi:hypothetical protein B5M06_13140 [Comamonas kerstersii]|uniref:AAA+ ATPase domain-containing protein n=2 Tax=Comamonas kerstersii TaxID=225992 RepID=A0A1V0BGT0_9BURK|nr:hypothetical protein B5M06_13140 [Comamonas kerstersii]
MMNQETDLLQLHLHQILKDLCTTQAALAKYLRKQLKLPISSATVCLICRYDSWPRRPSMGYEVLAPHIKRFLLENGATAQQLEIAFERVHGPRESLNGGEPLQRGNAAAAPVSPGQKATFDEDLTMLLRHQRLAPETRQHFKIVRDSFVNEMCGPDDVFLSDDIRYVRAAVRQTAQHGGMLAVTGESGSGKSTIRKDLLAWIAASGEPVIVIEPYVVGMSATSKAGRPLLASDITAAVIRNLAPSVSPRLSHERRTEQMHSILRESARVGNKHVLIIEEAHDLAVPTLKAMKRFYELEDGFKKLLSIILIGQPELARKLSEQSPEVREVVQRCELVTLPPLDNNVGDYLAFKFKRVGMDAEKIIEPGAVDAIRTVLRRHVRETFGARQGTVQSLCYPLAINNLLTRAMNAAVQIGAPKVTDELVMAAIRGGD